MAGLVAFGGVALAGEAPAVRPGPVVVSTPPALHVGRGQVGRSMELDRIAAAPRVEAAARPDLSSHFLRGYLLPQAARRLGTLGTVVSAQGLGAEPVGSAWRNDVARQVRSGAERALRRSVKDYVLDKTSFEFGRIGSAGSGESSGPGVALTRLAVGFAHGTPRIQTIRRSRGGALRTAFDLRGRLDVAWAPARSECLRIGASVDPRERSLAFGVDGSF